MSKMTLEQLQDKLLPILFDDNDKFEDVNRANILYDRDLDQITIRRTKLNLDDYRYINTETISKLIKILNHNYLDIENKPYQLFQKTYSNIIFTIRFASSIPELIL